MMLSTTNYVARQFGIRAGQPGYVGKELARQLGGLELKIIPTNFERYQELGGQVRKILATYDERFEGWG